MSSRTKLCLHSGPHNVFWLTPKCEHSIVVFTSISFSIPWFIKAMASMATVQQINQFTFVRLSPFSGSCPLFLWLHFECYLDITRYTHTHTHTHTHTSKFPVVILAPHDLASEPFPALALISSGADDFIPLVLWRTCSGRFIKNTTLFSFCYSMVHLFFCLRRR